MISGIESGIQTLGSYRLRQLIYDATLVVVTEEKLPAAQIALLHAQADLKVAAANVVDARRWFRLRGHTAALEGLIQTEGDTEIKPARFEEEGKVAEELRLDGLRLRQQAMEVEDKLKGRKS